MKQSKKIAAMVMSLAICSAISVGVISVFGTAADNSNNLAVMADDSINLWDYTDSYESLKAAPDIAYSDHKVFIKYELTTDITAIDDWEISGSASTTYENGYFDSFDDGCKYVYCMITANSIGTVHVKLTATNRWSSEVEESKSWEFIVNEWGDFVEDTAETTTTTETESTNTTTESAITTTITTESTTTESTSTTTLATEDTTTTTTITNPPNPDYLCGDVNSDNKFDVTDVVLLQKWLLAVPDTKLANWKAADFYADERLDVFDLCLMKRKLLNGESEDIYPVKNPEVIDGFTPCTATMEDEFVGWEIRITIKHQYSVPDRVWAIEDFAGIENIYLIEQSAEESPYRQILSVTPKNQSREDVLKLIHDIESLGMVEIKEVNTVFYATGTS